MSVALNSPEDYLRVISNHKKLVIIPLVLCLGIAGGLCLWLPKSYRSSTLLHFEEKKVRYVEGVDTPSSEGGAGGQDKAQAMMSGINKMKQILYRQELLTQVAQEFHLYGYEKDGTTPGFEGAVVGQMRGSVKIEIPKDSIFLRVSFAYEDPVVARDVTARLADLFIEEIAKGKVAIAESSSEFIQHELDKLKLQLEAKERALAQFKATHVGSLPEQLESNLRAIDRLEADSTAQTEMEKTLNTRLASVDKAIREYEDPGSETSPSPRRIAKDPRLAKINELERTLRSMQATYKESYPDLAVLRNEIRQLQAMTTEEYVGLHPDPADVENIGPVKSRRKSIDPYKAELLKQREDILGQLEIIQVRKARIASEVKKYEGRIESTSVHQQEILQTQRDYENLQKNYHSLLEKKLNASMAGDLERKRKGAEIQIIDPPTLPTFPETPNILLFMLGGLALGTAFGIGGAIGVELLRREFVSGEEVEMVLGLPVVSSISDFKSVWSGPVKRAISAPTRRHDRLLPLPGLKRDGSGLSAEIESAPPAPELVAMWYPRSVVAEQYRVAATRIDLMVGKKEGTVLAVTSALQGEGKSSTALNLAHVFSRDYGKKTVLIDCDFKRPMAHQLAGLEGGAGLCDVLLDQKSLEECLQYHEQLGLWLLATGNIKAEATVLTHMDRLSQLIGDLRSRFQYIILDAPPLLPVAEANLIARMSDILAFVIRARATGRDAVHRAIRLIGDDVPVAVVLNAVFSTDLPYYTRSHYELPHEPVRKQLQ